MTTLAQPIAAPVTFTRDQEAFRTEIHQFARDVVRPTAIAVDRIADPVAAIAPSSPIWDALRQTFELGYHKMGFPAALGGIEQIGRAHV